MNIKWIFRWPLTFLSLQHTQLHHTQIKIHTNGPATGRTTAGGAAIANTEGDPTDISIINTSRLHRSELTSSYGEDKATLLHALNWASAHYPTELITICNYNQTIPRGTSDTKHIRQRLNSKKSNIILIGIHGYNRDTRERGR